ncbi:unannotated protein [freshwater metagenome]|uniref:Unannotated protein n=1 Tax=freshwater metagenome TaxID=449393 RepID=A0A6J7PY98_9ZZZZ
MERLTNNLWDIGRVGDQPVVLRDGHCDADRVALLKCIGADNGVRDLASDDDERD